MKLFIQTSVLVSLLFTLSCSRVRKKAEIKTMNDYSMFAKELKDKVLLMGDTNSYNDLRVIYLEEPIEGLLPWALIMANKYGYRQAYYDVYYTLLKLNRKNVYEVDSLDTKTKMLAMEYLSIAVQKQQPSAIEVMDSIKRKLHDQ